MAVVASEFRSGWGVIVASAAGFGLGQSGMPFYTMGVFVDPLSKAFGWSASQIQGGLTLMLLANLAALPAAAWLCRRFGPRRVALGSVIGFALSFMSLGSLSGDLAGYYLRWVVMSAAGAVDAGDRLEPGHQCAVCRRAGRRAGAGHDGHRRHRLLRPGRGPGPV